MLHELLQNMNSTDRAGSWIAHFLPCGRPTIIDIVTTMSFVMYFQDENVCYFYRETIIQSLTGLKIRGSNGSKSMVSGTNHSSLDRHFFQNNDKNDKTHRAQNVYLSRPT